IWTFKHTKGEVLRYRRQLDITAPGPDGNDVLAVMKTVNKQEVKDVNEAGDTTLTQTTESSRFSLNGQEQPTDPAALTTTTQTVSKTGLILKQSVANGQPEWTKVYEISSMLTVTPAPTQPVKIGDTWK